MVVRERREDDDDDEGILPREEQERESPVGEGILDEEKPNSNPTYRTEPPIQEQERTVDDILADATIPTSIKFLKYASKHNDLTINQATEAIRARGYPINSGTGYQTLEAFARKKARLELAGEKPDKISNFYQGLVTAEDVRRLEPFLVEIDAKAKKQAREDKQQKKYNEKGDYGMRTEYSSPYATAYDQSQQQHGYPPASQPPRGMGAPETPKQAALRAILERMPRLNDKDRWDILQLYGLNSQIYENDSSRLFEFLTNALGGPRGQFIWKQLNMLTGTQAAENAETPLFSNMGGVFGNVASGADPSSSFNSNGMMPPMGGMGMGMPGMGGMNMGNMAGAPPQMQQMFYLMQMQQMMESMQDTKQEKMIKQMVQAAMMSVLSRSLEHKGGGGSEDLMSMLPLLAGGGIGVEEGVDAQGKPVKRLIPVKKEDSSSNPMMQMMANLNQQLIGGLITNKLGGDQGKEYRDFLKEMMMMQKEKNDPIEMLNKLRNGVPEVFGSQHQSLEEVRLNIESQLALMDKRFNFERLRWEREDKLHERAIQHDNMKEYMHSLSDIGTNIFKPVVDKVADGFVRGIDNQQRANVAQQQAAATAVAGAGINGGGQQQGNIGTIDFATMSDEQLEKYRKDRDFTMQTMNQKMQLINSKSAELDLEYQKRIAKRNSVPQAQAQVQPHEQMYANGSGVTFASRPQQPAQRRIPPIPPVRSYETGSVSALDEEVQDDLDETLGVVEEDYVGAAGVGDISADNGEVEEAQDEQEEEEEEEDDLDTDNESGKV